MEIKFKDAVYTLETIFAALETAQAGDQITIDNMVYTLSDIVYNGDGSLYSVLAKRETETKDIFRGINFYRKEIGPEIIHNKQARAYTYTLIIWSYIFYWV